LAQQSVIAEENVGQAFIVRRGNMTATIIWFAITTGVTAGLRYYKEREWMTLIPIGA